MDFKRSHLLELGLGTLGAACGVLLAAGLDTLLEGGGPRDAPRPDLLPHAGQLWLGMALAAALLVGAIVGRPGLRPRPFPLMAGLLLWSFLPLQIHNDVIPVTDMIRLVAAPALLLATLMVPMSGVMRGAVAAAGVALLAFPTSTISSYGGAWSGAAFALGFGAYMAIWTLRSGGRLRRVLAGVTGALGLGVALFISPELVEYMDAASMAIMVLGLAALGTATYALRTPKAVGVSA